MTLTKRGKRVKKMAQVIAWLLIIWLVFALIEYATTPPICRGSDISKLSQFCLDLRFPNS